jgi:hypothetical protein
VAMTAKLRANANRRLPLSSRRRRAEPAASPETLSTMGRTSSVIAMATTASLKLTRRSNPRPRVPADRAIGP